MALKLLLLSHRFYPDYGGIETNSEVLANAFCKAGVEVHVLTWTISEGTKNFPYKIIRNPSKSTLFEEHKWCDAVFENNPCLRMSWPNLFIHRPLIIALNTWVARATGERAWQDKFKLWWFKKAKAVIAVSNAVKQKCWPDAVVIGNPYNQELFKRIDEIEKNKNFVFLGRLVSDKGADQAIKAIAELIKKEIITGKEIQLTIIGDGPEIQSLQQLTSDLKINKTVAFAGVLRGEDLVRKLNEHKYILIPSSWEEPFGNIALEGMACGCLPIASDGGGLPDAVGDAGLTFKRNNIDSLVEVISHLLSNPQLENNLRNNFLTHLQAHRQNVVAQQYLQVIQKAIY